MTRGDQFLNCNWPFEKNMKLHFEGHFGEADCLGGVDLKIELFSVKKDH